MTLHVDHPAMLWLALLAVPLLAIGWRAMLGMDRFRRLLALALRAAVLLALVIMLAGPKAMREHDQLTVVALVDVSGSVQRFAELPPLDDLERRSNIEYLRRWLRQATASRRADDRFGLIAFDGRAAAISAPVQGRYVDDNLDTRLAEGTNIADAVRLGLAMFPPDTARRLVLLSDGNQTAGSAVDAARAAAATASPHLIPATRGEPGADLPARDSGAGVPIDIAPIEYHVTHDVQVVRVEAPANARPGQIVTVRVLLQATTATDGELTLLREGVPVDLAGAAEADGAPPRRNTARRVTVPAGQSVQLAQVALAESPVNRFEAIFEPLHAEEDGLPDNNRAQAFTATPSKGKVLIVDPQLSRRENLLASTLERAEIPTEAMTPLSLPADPLSLQAYDLIMLDNVAAYDLSPAQQDMLARYVNDQGGGLIMVGGDNSFGAGGWNNTPVESVLPVELDPPKEMRLPTAALVLVMDKSGSMARPVAGARASQQQVANEGAALAIESLRSESLVGVIAFDFSPDVLVPLQRNDDPKVIAGHIRGIAPEGGTAIEPALEAAFDMLRDVKVQKKRVVLLTDGRSPKRRIDEIVQQMAAADIKITTIAVGDDADDEALRGIAEASGGQFYAVRNPGTLPRVLIDSVQVMNKPLIKEGEFTPVVQATGSTLTQDMPAAPPLEGLVLTAIRPDPRIALEMTHPDGEPLLAHWQVGLGRAAVFTSDAEGLWSQHWVDWAGYGSFWTQLVRTIARPAVSHEAELLAAIEDGRLVMTLEASAPGAEGYLDYMLVEGSVYAPDGTSSPVRLRQTAPGRYEGSVPAPLAGNYIVALNPRRGSRQLAPIIGGVSQSGSAEFRRYESNRGLLEEIAQITGGRTLDLMQPQRVNLFDRSGMPPHISALPVWQGLLWATIGLLLLDVACRRVAWSAGGIQRALAIAVGRVRPWQQRAEEATATLAGLRQTSERIEQSLESRSGPMQKLEATRGIVVPPEREAVRRQIIAEVNEEAPAPSPASPRRAAPDEKQVAAALDALLRRHPSASVSPSGDAAPKPGAPPSDASAETPASAASKLAARRRAKRQGGDDQRGA